MRHVPHALRASLPVLGFLTGFAGSALEPGHQANHGTLHLGDLSLPAAEAGPVRRPRIHTLLIDLTHIEANNGERDDRRTARVIQQQIVMMRNDLLRAMGGELPFPIALQATLNNLYIVAGHNNRSADNDYDLVLRVSGSIEQMRLRANQILSNLGKYAPPPLPSTYRQPGALYVPEPYLPPTAPPPPAPPVYQQPQVYPQQPQVYPQQPQVYPQQPQVYPQQPQVYPQQTGMPMTPSQFQGLLNRVQRLSFSDEKINAVQDAVRSGSYFTCEQIVQLMRTSAFGDDQVKLGALLYPHAVDPQNFPLLTSALTFESDRQRLRKACGR